MNNKEEKGWEKEFDDEFTHIDWTGERKINMFCVTKRTFKDPIFKDEDEMVTKHKEFISKVEQDAYKRAVEIIKNHKRYDDAIEDVALEIEKLIKE